MNQVQVTDYPAWGIPEKRVRAQFNNNYAQAVAAGDPRLNVKAYDRPGLSRGAGAWNQGGIDAAKSMTDGIAQAYSTDFQNRQFNAGTALNDQVSREQNAQALGALNQQNAYADQMAALQRQQMMTNFASSLLGGLLQ